MTDGITITTTHGELRGTRTHGVTRFAGIPFAAPPVGPLRFRPPQPAEPWDGVRDASEFGTVCPQNASLMDALFGGEAERWDEDCLHLNVWTPDTAAEGRPVMVWIHGGGFEMGSGSSPLYHGEAFARSGVVLVTLNYRLGALGFLELGHLDPELAGSGNNGLLDQVAALEWVRDNIAAFGGDPANVTVFGESAGAMSVGLLLAMPRARGLFRRAIAESGAASAAKTPAEAADDADAFAATCGGLDLDELRSADVATLLAGHAALSASHMADPEAIIRRHGNPLAFLPFRPVADGREVPEDPLGAIAAGSAAGVELVVGTNLEEWKLFAMMAAPATDDDALRRRVELLSDDADAVIAAYRAEWPEHSPAELECAVLTDVVFRVPACRLADAQAPHGAVHQYRFDWRSPALGGLLGAAHAIEIPFVFDLVEDHRLHVLVGAEAPVKLARAVHESWTAFAASGVPAAGGLPEWPQVDEPGRPVMLLGEEPTLALDPEAGTRRAWSA
ncbi:MAG: carboxylesterase/lipase family protein [Microthrixaceae bacterium]